LDEETHPGGVVVVLVFFSTRWNRSIDPVFLIVIIRRASAARRELSRSNRRVCR
jgi:hypothetical protein